MHSLNMYEPATPHSTETEPLSVGDSGYAVCLVGVCQRVQKEDRCRASCSERARETSTTTTTGLAHDAGGRAREELISQEPPQWKLEQCLTHHTHSAATPQRIVQPRTPFPTPPSRTIPLSHRELSRYLRRQSYVVIPSRTDADAW